ncbi:hypothetical protein LguiA_026643 [Lonicera macranthoides]
MTGQSMQIKAKDMENVYHQIVNFNEHVGTLSGQIRIDHNNSIINKEDRCQVIREGKKIWVGECSNMKVNEVQNRMETVAAHTEMVSVEASSTESSGVEDLVSDIEMDDKSVAQTEIVRWKAPIPSSMTQLGLFPRATKNPRVTYARLKKEDLRIALLRDGALLNERVKQFNCNVSLGEVEVNG